MKKQDLEHANSIDNLIESKKELIKSIERHDFSLRFTVAKDSTFAYYPSEVVAKKIKTTLLNDLKAELKKLEKEFANL